MENDNQRIELVVRPDLIIGDLFLIFMPWAVTAGHTVGRPMHLNFRLEQHVWYALRTDAGRLLNGEKIKYPSALHHVVDGAKIEIRTRPEVAMHLMCARKGQKVEMAFDRAELQYFHDALDYIYRRTKRGKETLIIREGVPQQ